MAYLVNFIQKHELGRLSKCARHSIAERLTLESSNPVLAETPVSTRSTFLLKINADNTIIAAAHFDCYVALYSASTGEFLASCCGHEESPWSLEFHPQEPYTLASGCLSGSVRLWDISGAAKGRSCKSASSNRTRITPIHIWNQPGAIASLSFHPRYPILAVAWSEDIAFLNWKTGKTLSTWRFASEHSRVRWVQFSSDGSLLYTATANPRSFDDLAIATHISYRVNSPAVSLCTKDAALPRGELLRYLLTRPAAWFRELGICSTCLYRLCVWAAGLIANPSFPHRHSPSLKAIMSTLTAVATPFCHSECIARDVLITHSSDPHPSAVVVIEDIPAREWLFSSGSGDSYCKTEEHSSMCCYGHTRDLVAVYRELLQHSICRRCLRAFWQWANEGGRVDWWTWSHTSGTPSPQEDGEEGAEMNLGSLSSTASSSIDDSMGVCCRCNFQVYQTPTSSEVSSNSDTNTSGHQSRSINTTKEGYPVQPASKVARRECNGATTELQSLSTEVQARQTELTSASSRSSRMDSTSLGRGFKRKLSQPCSREVRPNFRTNSQPTRDANTPTNFGADEAFIKSLLFSFARPLRQPFSCYVDWIPDGPETDQFTYHNIATCCNCGGFVRKTRPVDLSSSGLFRNMHSRILLFAGLSGDQQPRLLSTAVQSTHEGISDIMSDLFADIGEHSSASYVRDVTHRICRWELRFCGFEEEQFTEEQENERECTCLPANLPIAYHKANLVAPLVRIFNDSSVCLSPDGRLLATVAVPVRDNSLSEREYLDGIVVVYRLQPEDRRGQCVFMQKLPDTSNPVCLHFSPSAEHLVVGLASCRLPSTGPVNDILRIISSCGPPPCVAHIFRVDRQHSPTEVQRGLTQVRNLPNPRLEDMPDASSIEAHHRSILLMGLAPNGTGISLNTILWHPHGIAYGTTKGLIVMVQPNPRSLPPQLSESFSSTSTTNHSPSMAETVAGGPESQNASSFGSYPD